MSESNDFAKFIRNVSFDIRKYQQQRIINFVIIRYRIRTTFKPFHWFILDGSDFDWMLSSCGLFFHSIVEKNLYQLCCADAHDSQFACDLKLIPIIYYYLFTFT